MKVKTITIKNKKYKVKYSIRALFIFEQITGKSFEIKTMLDNYLFFYCILLAGNQENPPQWDEFIDAIDADPTFFTTMNDMIVEQQKADKMFEVKDEDGNVKKN